jgi:hypothetical protein
LTPHLFFTATHNVRALPLSYVTKSLSAYRGAISTFSCQIYSRKKKEKKKKGKETFRVHPQQPRFGPWVYDFIIFISSKFSKRRKKI